MSSVLVSVHLERRGKLYLALVYTDTDSYRQCKECVREIEDGIIGVDSQRIITEDYRSLHAPSNDDSDEDESIASTYQTNFNSVTEVRTGECCCACMY